MTVIPTYTDIARKAVSLADERPDYIYERPEGGSCQYIADREAGTPGCIFGHALVALGVEATHIPEYLSIGNTLANLFLAGDVRSTAHDTSAGLVGYYDLLHAMRQAQVAQDKGTPWGEAIRPLRKALPELTLEDVAKRMIELAEDQPERTYIRPDGNDYGSCYYVHDGSTERFGGGCIVGQALVSLGVSPKRMTGADRGSAATLMSPDYGDVPVAGYDPVLLRAIDEAQCRQDRNQPWGEAIAPVVAYFEQVGK